MLFNNCPCNCFFAITLYSQTILPGDIINWSQCGLFNPVPAAADCVYQVTPGNGVDDDDEILAHITYIRTHIPPGEWYVIYFPPGDYYLDGTITLGADDRNIIFQGAGAQHTHLWFDFNGTNHNCFQFEGNDNGQHQALITDFDKATTNFRVGSSTGLPNPGWIRLCEVDHPVNGEDEEWAEECVGQISQITGITNWLTPSGWEYEIFLKDQASKHYSTEFSTELWNINPVLNIGIEDMTIERIDTGYPGGGNIGLNVYYLFAVNCWIKGVYFHQTCKHHVVAQYSSHIWINGCYFHDARCFEAGGYGYGVLLTQSTTNCLIENNAFKRLRHAMVAQAGANCNVFAFNYSIEQHWEKNGAVLAGDHILSWLGTVYGPGGDISLHGNYPYANLFEHNYIERIVADAAHGANWKYNAIVRNFVHNDFDNDHSWIYLRDAPNSSVLANVHEYSGNFIASEAEYHVCLPSVDCFGLINGYYYAHSYFTSGQQDEYSAYLPDISYYYTARPAFLPTYYTWPAIGPRVTAGGAIPTNNIPAIIQVSIWHFSMWLTAKRFM